LRLVAVLRSTIGSRDDPLGSVSASSELTSDPDSPLAPKLITAGVVVSSPITPKEFLHAKCDAKCAHSFLQVRVGSFLGLLIPHRRWQLGHLFGERPERFASPPRGGFAFI
jgi:hypothetical protein